MPFDFIHGTLNGTLNGTANITDGSIDNVTFTDPVITNGIITSPSITSPTITGALIEFVSGSSATGTPFSLNGNSQPSKTLIGMTGIMSGSGISGSNYDGFLQKIYVVNGLIVSASA